MSQMLSSDALPTLSLTLSAITKGDHMILLLRTWRPRLREVQTPAQGHTARGGWAMANSKPTFLFLPCTFPLFHFSLNDHTIHKLRGKWSLVDQKHRCTYEALWFFVFTFIMNIFKYIQNRDEYNETPSLHLPAPTMINLHPILIHLYLLQNPLHSTERNPGILAFHISICISKDKDLYLFGSFKGI